MCGGGGEEDEYTTSLSLDWWRYSFTLPQEDREGSKQSLSFFKYIHTLVASALTSSASAKAVATSSRQAWAAASPAVVDVALVQAILAYAFTVGWVGWHGVDEERRSVEQRPKGFFVCWGRGSLGLGLARARRRIHAVHGTPTTRRDDRPGAQEAMGKGLKKKSPLLHGVFCGGLGRPLARAFSQLLLAR